MNFKPILFLTMAIFVSSCSDSPSLMEIKRQEYENVDLAEVCNNAFNVLTVIVFT